MFRSRARDQEVFLEMFFKVSQKPETVIITKAHLYKEKSFKIRSLVSFICQMFMLFCLYEATSSCGPFSHFSRLDKQIKCNRLLWYLIIEIIQPKLQHEVMTALTKYSKCTLSAKVFYLTSLSGPSISNGQVHILTEELEYT